MLSHNKKMKNLLKKYGIDCMPKYIGTGSLKGLWRVYKTGQVWTHELINAFTLLGFRGFDGKPLHIFSGNGGNFCTFVKAPKEINDLVF